MRRIAVFALLLFSTMVPTATAAPFVEERISFYVITSCIETPVCVSITGNQITRSDGYTSSVINYYYNNSNTGEHVQGTPFGDYNLITITATHKGLVIEGGNISLTLTFTTELKENYSRSAVRRWNDVITHWRGSGLFQSAVLSGAIGSIELPITPGLVDQETLKQIK